jgi:hypothetical protein
VRCLALACTAAALLVAPTAAARGLADPSINAYGGSYGTATGESVRVLTSPLYPQADAVNQKWADFLATLVHGPELAELTLVLAPTGQVQQTCGLGAYACYNFETSTIVASNDRIGDGPTPEAVIAHEYGHHIASRRENAPWNAESWGTKRWATAMGICPKVRAGKLHPGDERVNYLLNPGEAFAESYRILNETALHLPPTPWTILDPSLQPTQAALDALRLDVTTPWVAPADRVFTGRFTRSGPRADRSYIVRTPLDGKVTVALSAPAGTSFRVLIGGRPARSQIVCGSRSLRVSVERVRGYGAYQLAVSPP